MGAEYRYLIRSSGELIKQIVREVGMGYYFMHVTYLPAKKKNKWVKIDEKMMQKYDVRKTKWQRYRRKERGLANFLYRRWEHVMVILHTLGDIPSGITYDDQFQDVRKKQVDIWVSDLVGYRIIFENGKVTAVLHPQTYRGIKAVLRDVARTKDTGKMVKEFDKLNGFPSLRGILRQKQQLMKYLLKQAGKHQVDLKEKDLRFRAKDRQKKVFVDCLDLSQ